jgi:putative phosphoesterase
MDYDVVRIAVMSDVHSNLAALDACIADSKRYKVKYYLFLGDLISDWHQPCEVLKRVRSVSNRVIRGNREEAILNRRCGDYGGIWKRYDQFASLEWTYNALSSDDLDYIESLPAQMRVPVNEHFSLRMAHGSVFHTNDLLYRKDGNAAVAPSLAAIQDNVLLFGHTHEQWQTSLDGKIAINPGSVGVHFNRQKGAEYAILEIEKDMLNVIFRQVEYRLDKYTAQFCKTDLYEKAYVWFLINYMGMQRGRNCLPEFLEEIEKERRETDLSTKGPVPNDIWYKVFEEKFSDKAMSFFLGGK